MKYIHGRIHIGSDETLRVPVPGMAGRDVEYTIIADNASAVNGASARAPMTGEAWRSFVDSLEGTIDDPTFVRPPQGDFEKRESMD